MYFWRIGPLREELRRGPVDQRSALFYILAWLILWTVLTLPPTSSEKAQAGDWASVLVILVASVLGTLLAYQANGGQHGSDFAARYFALGWVTAIRLLVLLLLPLFLLFIVVVAVMVATSGEQELPDATTAWIGTGLTVVFEVVYYWRLMHHFTIVAARDAGSSPTAV